MNKRQTLRNYIARYDSSSGHIHRTSRLLMVSSGLLLMLILALARPSIAHAHAILVHSDPAQDAVLSTPPRHIHLWFSEAFTPALSTATLKDGKNRPIEHQQVATSADNKEMDITLSATLAPDNYVVVWHTLAADDGHAMTGSFLFTVARPDGTYQAAHQSTNQLASLLTAPTLLNFTAITLIELGAVIWAGAAIWLLFVCSTLAEKEKTQQLLYWKACTCFEQRILPPVLLALFVAHFALLAAQAAALLGGQWTRAFSWTLLRQLITDGQFGIYWTVRVLIITFALLLTLYRLRTKQRQERLTYAIQWGDMILSVGLLCSMALSSHAAAAPHNILTYALLADWLHLLAAALWVGGMAALAICFIPILRSSPTDEQARSLLTVLHAYSPWALAGVAIMAITGPFSATVHLTTWQQLFTTAYGQALTIKSILVGALLLTSTIHVFILRPRLQREEKEYALVVKRLEDPTIAKAHDANADAVRIHTQVKLHQHKLAYQITRMLKILRYEPVLGIAVIICVGVLNVSAGTLAAPPVKPPVNATTSAPFRMSSTTSDKTFSVTLTVTPGHTGTNTFTASVIDPKTGKSVTNVGVSLYVSNVDMDMGEETINLQPDTSGSFKASGDLIMPGHQKIRIQIRTLQDTLHEVTITMSVSYRYHVFTEGALDSRALLFHPA